MKQFFASALEILEAALIAIVTVFIIRTFLVQPFLVSGASMEPTFYDGNYLLVDELSYHLREPERGESIVFRYPGDEKTYFIKRIIGLPGERVKVSSGKVEVFPVDGRKSFFLNESYLPASLATSGDNDITLKENEYFVLGDNRAHSFDSRAWGVLKKKEIIGEVRIRLWPLNEMTFFQSPNYR